MTENHNPPNLTRQESIVHPPEASNLPTKRIDNCQRTETLQQMECKNFETVLDTLPNGAYIIDRHHLIEYTNQVMIKEFGPAKGRKCYEYLNARTEPCPWCKLEDVLSGNTLRWHWYCHKTGKSYNLYEAPVINSRPTILKLTILYDMTHFEKTEMALRESEKQLRNLSYQLLTVQEAERSRISRELHDELGGALAVLKLKTSSIEKNLDQKQTALSRQCKQNLLYIDQLIENVHRLSRDLSPSMLEDLGLTTALRWLIDNFAKHYGIFVDVEIESVDHLVPKLGHIMLYRTLQEILTNIGKHAQPEKVVAKLKRDQNRISLFIEDDGNGFDMELLLSKKLPERGLGLATMRERVKMMGGDFQLWSEPGKGTQISLSVPIIKEEEP